jgi:hypothetical protein
VPSLPHAPHSRGALPRLDGNRPGIPDAAHGLHLPSRRQPGLRQPALPQEAGATPLRHRRHATMSERHETHTTQESPLTTTARGLNARQSRVAGSEARELVSIAYKLGQTARLKARSAAMASIMRGSAAPGGICMISRAASRCRPMGKSLTRGQGRSEIAALQP